jgi:hypothetical protein
VILTPSLPFGNLDTPCLLWAGGRAKTQATVLNLHPAFLLPCHADLGPGTNTLPAPSPDKTLSALTLALGNLSYLCTSGSPDSVPVYLSQQTTLFDVAPLIQFIPSEDALHSLVPQLYTYNYAALANSSLDCIGNIYTDGNKTTVDLTGYQPFILYVNDTIAAPNPQADSCWTQSLSEASDWEGYRVETVGGAVPTSCAGLSERFKVGYAAEYWFYHG